MKAVPVSKLALRTGETLAYRERGQGPALLLIHGNMASSVHWQTTLEALSPYFRVIAPDLRGFGDSSYHQTFDSMLALAEDVEAFLDALGVSACAVVGWSAGGGVAMELAAKRSDLVSRLILLTSVPLTGYPILRKDEKGQPIPGQLVASKEEIASDPVQVLPVLSALAAGDKAFMRAVWNATIYNRAEPPAEEYDAYLDATLKQRCLVDVDYALLTFNMSSRHNGVTPGNGRFQRIKCPIHIFQGEKDLVVPLAWGQQMHQDFGERAEFISFVQAGHSVMTDAPALFFSTLKGVLGVREMGDTNE